MKLRNRKTGEIIETDFELSVSIPDDEKLYGNDTYTQIKGYSSIKELSEDWEDVPEEPKQGWYINENNEPQQVGFGDPIDDIEHLKELGLLFDTEEECGRAIERMKAWKRLRDKGFEFTGLTRFYTGRGNHAVNYSGTPVTISFNKSMDVLGQDWIEDNKKDLDLLFGGEDDN